MSSNSLSLSPLPPQSQWFGFLPDHATIMIRRREAQAPATSPSPSPWTAIGNPAASLVLIDASFPRSAAARELLEKMIFALGKTLQDVRLYELAAPGQYTASITHELTELTSHTSERVALLLGEEAAQLKFDSKLFKKVILTHSPMHLLQHPEKKRASWEHLQQAARELGWPLPSPSKKGTR